MATERTREEIEDLKRQWDADPCWDLADTEGFEAHREELAVYEAQEKAEWHRQRNEELLAKAALLGCDGNIALARYVERLEDRIERLERDLFRVLNPNP